MRQLWIGYRSSRYEIRSWLGQYPFPYLQLAWLKPRSRPLLVGRHTELVMGGFPRSGNTFAIAAFQLAQPRPVSVAHHLHVPASVLWAVRRRVPALVLIRQPADAVLSTVIFAPFISLRQALRDYLRFYHRLRPYRDGFVVGPFDEITRDFGRTIARLNRRFGTDFALFEHTDEAVKRAFELVEEMDMKHTGQDRVTETHVARPSTHRHRLKAQLARELQSPALRRLLEQAQQLFASYIGDLDAL